MKEHVTYLVAALATVAAAGPAMAQQRPDPYAQAVIARGDYDNAERMLRAEARVYPNKPEVLLNLAAVLARTNRPDQAKDLYDRVLEEEPVEMRLANGRVVGSHAIALTGMSRLRSQPETALGAR